MTTLTLPIPQTRQPVHKKDLALAFIDSIDSTLRGHERFAMWLTEQLHPQTVVDIGFDRGLSTLALAYHNRGHVFGIDWFEEGEYATKSFALDNAFRNISHAIRLNYAKNIHLIIGLFSDVAKSWKRKIDILHIDLAKSYPVAKRHFEDWAPFLQSDGVVLLHNVVDYPDGAGRFFREIDLPKLIFPHARGLGVATSNGALLERIRSEWAD